MAGMLLGYVHDRRLLREAQAHLGVRWFIGYGLHEDLPDHSSLTRIRQRWGAARFKAIFRRTVRACLEAGVAKAEVVHVDASLIRADVSWASLAERHADEVLRENPAEEEEGRKDKGRRGGGSGKVSRTDPDARLARKSARAGYEPSYKHHAAVDDERGVVLDVAVTEGTRNERAMLESHLEAVGELSGRAPALVTADSGYAYSKVYGALERRGVDGVIPAKGEPSQSRVPLRRFHYDARNDIVKCPRGKTLTPRRNEEGGRRYGSKTRDCAGCALRADCLSESQESKAVLIPHAYPALLRARPAACALGGGGASAVAPSHVVARRATTARRRAGTDWGGRCAGAYANNVRIQSYLTATAVNLKRLAAALAARLFAPWRVCVRPETPPARAQRHLAPVGLALRKPRETAEIARSRNRVFQQPRQGGVGGLVFRQKGSHSIIACRSRNPFPVIARFCHHA